MEHIQGSVLAKALYNEHTTLVCSFSGTKTIGISDY